MEIFAGQRKTSTGSSLNLNSALVVQAQFQDGVPTEGADADPGHLTSR
jgi:hypothetical protein